MTDPDYGRAFTRARCACWSHGYALLQHGTATRDLDLLAVPWTEKACDAADLFDRVLCAIGPEWMHNGHKPSPHPHGRTVWTFVASGGHDPRYIDFGVMPKKEESP